VRILLTGADGFIGLQLWTALQQTHDVKGIDLLEGDLTKLNIAAALIKRHKPQLVIHLAGLVGRLFGEDDVARTITANAIATTYIAQACAEAGIRLTYASTSEAFGDHGDRLVPESDHGVLPYNMYGLSKRWGEEACRLYMPEEDLQIFRLSMPYGPGLAAGRGRAALITFLFNAIHHKPITVHAGGTRSWCYITDTIKGIGMVIEDGGSGAWLVGRADNETSMLKVAEMACDIAGAPRGLIEVVDAPENQTLVKRLDPKRLYDIGWTPKVNLDEGVKMTYRAVKYYNHAGRPQWP
jgi:nucleoside-diphosphate-sugar epimerase